MPQPKNSWKRYKAKIWRFFLHVVSFYPEKLTRMKTERIYNGKILHLLSIWEFFRMHRTIFFTLSSGFFLSSRFSSKIPGHVLFLFLAQSDRGVFQKIHFLYVMDSSILAYSCTFDIKISLSKMWWIKAVHSWTGYSPIHWSVHVCQTMINIYLYSFFEISDYIYIWKTKLITTSRN